MAVVGIDLGTTYSVVATPQQFAGKYFDTLRGVTIIKDEQSRRLTPSVVAVNRQGDLLVGWRAKSQVGQSPAPIMFVKRSMGDASKFALGDRRLRPEEVSAEILRYLKQMAEKQMGEPIEEAVITVPAYFTTGQKQKTKEAGELAGLRVGEILQEPVAAALAYCYDDTRDPLTIMTYDLGGGTFDVAIVRKAGGVFEIKAFDGDRHLGGYDFDKRLAFWILDRLEEQNYRLSMTPESPAWSKLLVFAETAKVRLSDREVHNINEQNSGILDDQGEPVAIDLEITREVFEELIKDHVAETIRLCRRALENARLDAGQVDEIVMVGGSSRIPLVPQRLEAEFGVRPRLSEPDLSIAIGAAIMATRLDQHVGPLTLGHLPEATSLTTIDITGSLHKTAQLPAVEGGTVTLILAGGAAPKPQRVDAQGGFLFERVPLAAEGLNSFSLRVSDPAGREVLTHPFTVRRQAAGVPVRTLAGLETNVLAKPISINTVSGLHTVAPAKTPLPYDCHVPAQTTDQTGTVRIPVYEDTYPIGEIVVEGVPTHLPIGSRVDVTLTLRTDFNIDGEAEVPAAKVKGRTTIRIPPIEVKDIVTLRQEHKQLEREADEALGQADRSTAFRIRPRLKQAIAASTQLLHEERAPDLGKAQELLDEIRTLIGRLSSWQPEPPAEQFDLTREEIETELLPSLDKLEPAAADGGYTGQLKAIAQMGKKALADKDENAWADANRRLGELRDRIVAAQERAERRRRPQTQEPPPDPRTIKIKLSLHLTQLREDARRRGRLAELEVEFQTCDTTLKGIDLAAPDALDRLLDYFHNLYQPLESKVVGGKAKSGDRPRGWVEVLNEASRNR